MRTGSPFAEDLTPRMRLHVDHICWSGTRGPVREIDSIPDNEWKC